LKINNLIKLSIYKNEKIVIENYKELRDIHEEEIVVDIYTIKGLFLKIKRMDNYMIVKIAKDDIAKVSGCEIKNLQRNDGEISFLTNKKSFQSIRDKISEIKYVNILKNKIKYIIKTYMISIISILIIMLLLINQSKSISNIEFINYNTYDSEVEEFIREKCKKIGPFYYLNTPINNINKELKQKFYYYEWISITKKGSIIEVNINKQQNADLIKDEENVKGDLIASQDAIIKMYYVKKGVVLIKEMQAVNAGDVLVTGNLKYHIGQVEYIKADGIVIGETLKYEIVKVEKKITNESRTGRIEVIKKIVFFDQNPNVESHFKDYDVIKEEVFNISSFIKMIRYTIYEKSILIQEYTLEQALAFAKSKIQKDFTPSKYETIKSIQLVRSEETEENFYFKFVVKKYENIAVFQKIMD